jgi:uncharacterized protein YecT (DUF1311 family)
MNIEYKRNWAVTRIGAMILITIFASQHCTGQQQGPERPKKVLTPEQVLYQKQSKAYLAKRLSLQGQAKQVFDAEMAREKAGDCPNAATTYDSNVCLGRELTLTEQNLKSYEGIIEGLLSPPPQMPGQAGANVPGPAGPSLTPKQLTEEFESVERGWRAYRETACAAAFHQFDGGTGGPSFQMECELKLTRDHMRELDMIYGGDLHR